ncbi:TolC family protein [Candidatus Viadribacter manganicus]|uniref:TolC family protein n=1 Tax=Candidatus Viadribacter manganicus TaxID=1759059 RepID=UPI001D17C876|nr:TolC family protein [Candidatus Viadribacter manganicus]
MSKQLILAVALTGALAAPSWAQTRAMSEGPSFQSEAAIAMSTNPALAGERARVRAVRQSLPEAWSELLPQVTGEAQAIEQDGSERENLPAFTIREQPEYWIASVRASTLLFGSGRVMASTRRARAEIAASVALYQDAVQRLALDFTQAYAETIFARQAVIAQQESLANLEEQVRFARANQREGFLTRTDVAQAEARVAEARADLARARARVVEASELYTRIVGHTPGELGAPPALVGLPTNLDDAWAMARDEHPRIVAAAAELAGANANVDLAASAGRLRLFLESTNSTYDAIGGDTDFEQQFDSTVSVRVSVPLFSGGANHARVRRERYVADANRYELLDIQRRVHEQLNVAWSARETAQIRLEASRARLEAAELANRGTRREQQFGQRSMIDVLNQEQEWLAARVGVSEAERDLVIAERALAASIGIIGAVLGVEAQAHPRRERAPRPVIVDNDELW